MSVPVIGFFNNKGGVGKTSLVYHLAWMFADLGKKVLAADLDPQANLTAAFIEEERLEELWPDDGPHRDTVYGAIEPLLRGIGDVVDQPHLEPVTDGVCLLVGDLALAGFEDELSQQWPLCLDGKERAFRVISAFWRLIQQSGAAVGADVALVDLGPNLGAINRAALIATDHVVVPLGPDLFSLQGLKNLGPTFWKWREGWDERLKKNPAADLDLPSGEMQPVGYVVMQHAVRLDRPVKAYERWVKRIPSVYAQYVACKPLSKGLREGDFDADPNCLHLLKHYRSLMPMAQEARKPMFHLRAADGAIGSHVAAAADVRRDFERLARAIAERCDVQLDPPPGPAGA
jgi:cellulose biosynthesis protein BcsQ